MLNRQGLFGVEFDTAHKPVVVLDLGTTRSTVNRIKWSRVPGVAPVLDAGPVRQFLGATSARAALVPWVFAVDDLGSTMAGEEEQCI